MTRSAAFAAVLAAGLATPALANPQMPDTSAAVDPAALKAFTAQLGWAANQREMRKFLAYQGYIVTSDLDRKDNGYWLGRALKDGEPVIVGLKMPRDPAPPLTN